MGENNEKTKPSLGRKMRLKLKISERGGHWGILETAETEGKKSSKTAKPQKNCWLIVKVELFYYELLKPS